MLLHNVMRHKVASALVGQPKLDNVFTSKKKKKAKAPKVAKGPYGGVGGYGYGGIYSPVNTDGYTGGGSSDGGGGGGDGGGGGGS